MSLETRGVKIQRKCSRRLWRMFHRRLRIADREFTAYAIDRVFGQSSTEIGLAELWAKAGEDAVTVGSGHTMPIGPKNLRTLESILEEDHSDAGVIQSYAWTELSYLDGKFKKTVVLSS